MMEPTDARRVDLEATVIATFQRYLGVSRRLPLSARLFEDLGVDSLTFVAALFELSERLGLSIQAAEVDLGKIQTLEDVIDLAGTLSRDRDSRPAR